MPATAQATGGAGMTTVIESWRTVPNWPHYEVSDRGRVRSVDRTVPSKTGVPMRLKGQLLSQRGPSKNRHHYAVALHSDGRRRDVLVHRLVLETFVGPCPPGLEGCHADDDPANNVLSNLRWDTRGANQRDSVRNRHHGNSRKTHCPKRHRYDLVIARGDGRTYRACSICRRNARRSSTGRA